MINKAFPLSKSLFSPVRRSFGSIDKQNVITLTNTEKKRISDSFSRIPYDPTGAQAYIFDLRKKAYNSFPARLVEALESQRVGLGTKPYILIDNLPFDEVDGTPSLNESATDFKSTDLSENLVVAISSLIGEPYSIFCESQELVNNIIPHKQTTKLFSSLGSAHELDFHSENAALKYHPLGNLSPTGLTLTGVRYDHLAVPKTRVCDTRLALASLTESEKEILRGRNYQLKVPVSWRSSLTSGITQPCPIIKESYDNNDPEVAVAFYSDMVTPLSKKASEVLEKLHQIVKEKAVAVDIKPGTMIYIDNRFTLHSRDAYQANYDANGKPLRWLQRIFVKDSLWSFRGLKQEKDRVFNQVELANALMNMKRDH